MLRGRYERVRRLAVGGMGEIFLARAPGSSTFVVLKTLLPQRDEDGSVARMFSEEARLHQLLRHPNIVRVLDVYVEHGEPTIALEYVDGEPLTVLRRAASADGWTEPWPFVELVAQAARGLDAAHRAIDKEGRPLNIVHRDVSPHNIMVGRDGIAKLLDFGIAKASTSADVTSTQVVKGKLVYMAPEQLAGARADLRSDLYSLGIVLWELVLNRRAYQGLSDLEILTAATTLPLQRPSALVPTIPPALDDVIAKAIERKPHARFESAGAFADALERILPATRTPLSTFITKLLGAPGVRSDVVLPQTRATSVGADIATSVLPKTPTATRVTQDFPVAAEASLFEGLFRGVKLSPTALGELERIGVNPKKLEAKYRVDVWSHTIEIVRRHVYGDLPPDEANRRLGWDFAHGFESTIGGRMVLSLLPLLSLNTLLPKIPRFFKLGRPDIDISWTSRGPKSGSLRVKDVAQVSPFFDVGLVQYIIERMGSKCAPRVEWHSLTEFSIHYDW